MFKRLSVPGKLLCMLRYARLEIWNMMVLEMSGDARSRMKSMATDKIVLIVYSLHNKPIMRVFLPFLLRSIAASKRTSSSPFGKTGTTQRGLEEEKKHLLMTKINHIVKQLHNR